MTPKIKPAPVDVVIVGLGANGGTAAKVLSEAGLKVVGLERGPWLKNDKHYSGDELKFVNRNYMWPDSKLTLVPYVVAKLKLQSHIHFQ